MKQDIKNMRQDILNKDVITEDMIFVGSEITGLRITDNSQYNKKLTFTDDYIEAITADERFISALMLNDNFIQNIKTIVGGME